MRRQIPHSTWREIQTAYTGGIPLREVARKMGIAPGTILSRAKRDNWTQQAAIAKLQERPELARDLLTPSSNITTSQAVAVTMRERADHYIKRMAGVGERVLPHLEGLTPQELLDESDKIDRIDRVARRTFGLDKQMGDAPIINLNLLSMGLDAFTHSHPKTIEL